MVSMVKLVRPGYWWMLLGVVLLYLGYRIVHPAWEDAATWKEYQQIHLGMRADEALDVFDGGWNPSAGPPFLEGKVETRRIGEDVIELHFDKYNRVDRKWARIQGHVFSDPPTEQPWWDRLRARFGW
jgi:hypothetical protein